METITVRGTPGKADMLPLTRFTVMHRSPFFRVLFIVGVLFVIAGTAGQFTDLPFPGSVAFLGLFYLALPVVSPWLTIRKFLRSPIATEEALIEVAPEEFRLTRPSSSVSLRWNAFHSVVELPGCFGLFTTRNCFIALPKHLFSEAQTALLHDFFERSMKENGKAFESRIK